ncbi:MAG: hypothetical protein NTV00_11090 [Methylococcales bacterium]|nr:hypothetical protein [Methylococcales bacterium]
MKSPKHLLALLLLTFFSISLAQASGAPVNEDYEPLIALSNTMIELAKQNNTGDFLKKMDEAMKSAKEMALKNNSITLTRVTPKLRAAKKALKAGNITECVDAIEQGKALLMEKKTGPTWDGGA